MNRQWKFSELSLLDAMFFEVSSYPFSSLERAEIHSREDGSESIAGKSCDKAAILLDDLNGRRENAIDLLRNDFSTLDAVVHHRLCQCGETADISE